MALYFYYLFDTNSTYVLNMRIFKLALIISAFLTIVLSAFNVFVARTPFAHCKKYNPKS